MFSYGGTSSFTSFCVNVKVGEGEWVGTVPKASECATNFPEWSNCNRNEAVVSVINFSDDFVRRNRFARYFIGPSCSRRKLVLLTFPETQDCFVRVGSDGAGLLEWMKTTSNPIRVKGICQASCVRRRFRRMDKSKGFKVGSDGTMLPTSFSI